jgi:hypothetical protein
VPLPRWAALALLCAVAAQALPPAPATPVPGGEDIQGAPSLPEVRLFLHPIGGTSFRINTQPPRATYLEERPLAEAPGCAPPLGSRPGPYVGRSEQALLEAGSGRVGFMDEARLQQGVDASTEGLELRWVMAARSSVQGVSLPAQVTVAASLRDLTPDRGEAGPRVLAEGSSGTATLARQDSAGATWSEVGGLDVYEVTVPLAWAGAPRFPQEGYTLLVEVRTDLGAACMEGVQPAGVSAYADPAHTSHLRAFADAPPRVLELGLSPGEEGRVLAAAVAGAWGSSDVDAANATLEVRGADGRPWPVALVARQEAWRAFNHSFDPVRLAWVWNATGAPVGPYTATLAVPNLQHTAAGTATLGFRNEGARASPAGGLLAALLGLGAALARRRF